MHPTRFARRLTSRPSRLVSLVLAAACSWAILSVPAGAETATSPAPQPVADAMRVGWSIARGAIERDADAMPAESFAYRPVADVRTFGQLVIHVSESLLVFCSAIQGEPNPVPGFVPGQPGPGESQPYDKASATTLLDRALGRCDAAFADATDAALGAPIDLLGRPSTVAFAMAVLIGHTQHHDGNLVTYLRLEGIVPPASRPAPSPGS